MNNNVFFGIVAFVIQFATIVGFFTSMENRLTKIETTIEIKLGANYEPPNYPNAYRSKKQDHAS